MQLVAYGALDYYLVGYGQGQEHGQIQKFRIYYKTHIINDIVDIKITGWKFIEFIKITNNSYSEYNTSNMFNYTFDTIDCSKSNMKKIPRFNNIDNFRKLKSINCSHNRIKSIEKFKYIDLIKLDCSNNLINKIPNKMNSLEYFNFSNNFIRSKLDFTNYPRLKYLMASSNQINGIINCPNKLIYLDLSNNPVDQLDNLPNSLEYLLIVQTLIKNINLVNLTNLKYLDLSINNLINLDGLPGRLVYLNCSQCEITCLDNLPSSINKLICINNNLKSLDMLPESICYLNCAHNNITKLDDLPRNLTELICSSN